MAGIDIVLLFISAGALLAIAYAFAMAWFEFPRRNAEDVLCYLLPVDVEKMQSLLDPAVEYSYRLYFSPQEFRFLQRKRLHQFMELVERLSRNSVTLMDYADEEIDRNDPLTLQAAQALREHAFSLRLHCLAAKMAIYSWLLVRLRAPIGVGNRFSLPRLRELYGIAALDTYSRLKDAAITLYGLRRPNGVDDFLQAL